MKPLKTLSIIFLTTCLCTLGCGGSEHSEPQSEQEVIEIPAQSLSQNALRRPSPWQIKVKRGEQTLYQDKVGFYTFETELALTFLEPCDSEYTPERMCFIYEGEHYVRTMFAIQIDQYHRSPKQHDYWHCNSQEAPVPCEKLTTELPWYSRDLITLDQSFTRLASSLGVCETTSSNQTFDGRILHQDFNAYPEPHRNIYFQLEVDCGSQKELLDVYLEEGPNRY